MKFIQTVSSRKSFIFIVIVFHCMNMPVYLVIWSSFWPLEMMLKWAFWGFLWRSSGWDCAATTRGIGFIPGWETKIPHASGTKVKQTSLTRHHDVVTKQDSKQQRKWTNHTYMHQYESQKMLTLSQNPKLPDIENICKLPVYTFRKQISEAISLRDIYTWDETMTKSTRIINKIQSNSHKGLIIIKLDGEYTGVLLFKLSSYTLFSLCIL